MSETALLKGGWRVQIAVGSPAAGSLSYRHGGKRAIAGRPDAIHYLPDAVEWFPEEGRRSGFDSHERQRAPEPQPGSTPGRHFASKGDATLYRNKG